MTLQRHPDQKINHLEFKSTAQSGSIRNTMAKLKETKKSHAIVLKYFENIEKKT